MALGTLDQTAVEITGGTKLSLGDFVTFLKLHRRLRGQLLDGLVEKLFLEGAQRAGLAVSTEELQQSANLFRSSYGMTSAARTQEWLDAEGITLAEMEAALEREILVLRFRDQLGAAGEAQHFAAHRDAYARAKLRMLVASSEGFAKEIHSQINYEGRDFAEMVQKHSIHLQSRVRGGDVGFAFRYQLPAATAAAVFAARQGAVVGPFQGENGWQLFLVETLMPPELDAATRAVVRHEVVEAWLREQLAGLKFHT